MSFWKCIFKNLIKLIILFCLFNLGTSESNETDDSLQMKSVEPRIVGGYRPNENHLAKYVVSIRPEYEPDRQFGYQHFCAGTIIEANVILTAGHCVYWAIGKAYLKIVAKTPKRLSKNSQTQVINVERVIIHSEYDNEYLYNDIALLVLEEDLSLDSEMAAELSLPKRDINPGELCQIIGWGRLYIHGPLANDLLYADVNLKSLIYCRRRYPRITSKKICASNTYDYEVDACMGDSGGPLICSGVVAGVVSYGYGCAFGLDTVYTNVYKYLDWIEAGGQILLKPSIFIVAINLFVNVAL